MENKINIEVMILHTRLKVVLPCDRRVGCCHTLISSGDDPLQTFGFLPAELSCLTPIAPYSVRFFDVSEGNVQNTQKEAKRVTFGAFFSP